MPKVLLKKTDREPEREVFLAFARKERETCKFCKLFYPFFFEMVSNRKLDGLNLRIFLFCLMNSDFEGKIDFSQREMGLITGTAQSTVSRSVEIMIDLRILIRLKRESVNTYQIFLNPQACWKSTPNRRRERTIYFNGRLFAENQTEIFQEEDVKDER